MVKLSILNDTANIEKENCGESHKFKDTVYKGKVTLNTARKMKELDVITFFLVVKTTPQ